MGLTMGCRLSEAWPILLNQRHDSELASIVNCLADSYLRHKLFFSSNLYHIMKKSTWVSAPCCSSLPFQTINLVQGADIYKTANYYKQWEHCAKSIGIFKDGMKTRIHYHNSIVLS